MVRLARMPFNSRHLNPNPYAAKPKNCLGICSRAETEIQSSTAEGTRTQVPGPEATEQLIADAAEGGCRRTAGYSEVQRSTAMAAWPDRISVLDAQATAITGSKHTAACSGARRFQ